MRIEQARAVVEQYITALGNLRRTLAPRKCALDKRGLPNVLSLEHALWMLHEMRTMLHNAHAVWSDPEWDLGDTVDGDKINRWLGFVQGVLWTTGVYTIDDMRDHNRQKE